MTFLVVIAVIITAVMSSDLPQIHTSVIIIKWIKISLPFICFDISVLFLALPLLLFNFLLCCLSSYDEHYFSGRKCRLISFWRHWPYNDRTGGKHTLIFMLNIFSEICLYFYCPVERIASYFHKLLGNYSPSGLQNDLKNKKNNYSFCKDLTKSFLD